MSGESSLLVPVLGASEPPCLPGLDKTAYAAFIAAVGWAGSAGVAGTRAGSGFALPRARWLRLWWFGPAEIRGTGRCGRASQCTVLWSYALKYVRIDISGDSDSLQYARSTRCARAPLCTVLWSYALKYVRIDIPGDSDSLQYARSGASLSGSPHCYCAPRRGAGFACSSCSMLYTRGCSSALGSEDWRLSGQSGGRTTCGGRPGAGLCSAGHRRAGAARRHARPWGGGAGVRRPRERCCSTPRSPVTPRMARRARAGLCLCQARARVQF